jgi:hypothetical protein
MTLWLVHPTGVIYWAHELGVKKHSSGDFGVPRW